jgi:hypothetical protein
MAQITTPDDLVPIRERGSRAVQGHCAWGGHQYEAWLFGGVAFIQHLSDEQRLYAELTVEQWHSLWNATDWNACGASDGSDVRVTQAAAEWSDSQQLDWMRIGRHNKFIYV